MYRVSITRKMPLQHGSNFSLPSILLTCHVAFRRDRRLEHVLDNEAGGNGVHVAMNQYEGSYDVRERQVSRNITHSVRIGVSSWVSPVCSWPQHLFGREISPSKYLISLGCAETDPCESGRVPHHVDIPL